ncbi:MAG: FixH family protein [Alphaproteobacteria bacterium]|nr:FixH family protein [Alphaproteobacteria bacterium]
MTRFIPCFLIALAACGEKDEHEHSGAEDTANYEELTETSTDSYLVRWSSSPAEISSTDYFALTVEVFDIADGSTPMPELEVSVDAQMPAHGHGMTVVPTTINNGDGTYTADPLLFHMEGHWEILVDVGGEEAVFHYTCCGS